TIVIVVLMIVALVRVASTFRVFSETADEPTHLAAGFQLLASGRYDIDPEHPPLARVVFALSPFLSGAKVTPDIHRTAQGNELLYRDNRYRHNLANVRAGN